MTTREIVEKILQILRTGRANLIIGDLTASQEHNASKSKLTHGLHKLLPGYNGLDFFQLSELAKRKEPDAWRRLLKSYIDDVPEDPDLTFRILRAPWKTIYAIAGHSFTNVKVERLQHPVDFRTPDDTTPEDPKRTTMYNFVPSRDDAAWPNVFNGLDRAWDRLPAAIFATLAQPTVIFAKRTDDLIWRLLEQRSSAQDGETDLEDAVFVVENATPIDIAFAELYNVTLHTCQLDEVVRFLQPGNHHIAHGRSVLNHGRGIADAKESVHLINELIELSENVDRNTFEFLSGSQPTWQDIRNNRPVKLTVHKEIVEECILSLGQRNIVVYIAPAGASKTTSLMQTAMHFHVKKKKTIAWIDRDVQIATKEIERRIDELDPDMVFIDDLNIFGERIGELLSSLNLKGSRNIVCAFRSVHDSYQRYLSDVQLPVKFVEWPEALTDDELEKFVACLQKGASAGKLSKFPDLEKRISHLKNLSDGSCNLLGALMEVSLGKPYHEMLLSEFGALEGDERLVYSVASVLMGAWTEMSHVEKADLVRMIASTNEIGNAFAALSRLVKKGLLRVDSRGGVRCRHRAIANSVSSQLPESKRYECIEIAAKYYARQATEVGFSYKMPQVRMLQAIISHANLSRAALSHDQIDQVYWSVHEELRDIADFWIQWSAALAAMGRYDKAEHHADQAVYLSDEHTRSHAKAVTQRCHVRLQRLRASQSWGDPDCLATIEEAMSQLLSAVKDIGTDSPHTYVVLSRYCMQALKSSFHTTNTKVKQIISEFRNICERLSLSRLGPEVNDVVGAFLTAAKSAEVKPAVRPQNFPTPNDIVKRQR